ncbi:hypothetical protein NG701_07625 [Pseudarthrobacter sp. HLT3-5]|uniref:hypothetical protein n=1 Tax=Pseudarthrobacter cellobiosi TaxID=2953654 RepID=UPI00208F8CFC|nr:hypothetical protein [Pseudarthrobacter sp. HLT3-5]MCO4274298.1 hypothetical protein [Pseudarthrobacter sp. HLT3-5]
MTVASLELCKELYELSGWVMPSQMGHTVRNEHGVGKEWWALYDLSYLLSKLPETIRNAEHSFWYRWHLTPLGHGFNISYQNDAWVTSHKSSLKRDGFDDEQIERLVYWQLPHYSDSAADVVAKLGIELFKQGIVTKEAGDVS